jgi:hypothetical protein
MSVINAIAEARTFRAVNLTIELRECCRLLRLKAGSAATFDYDAVETLEPAWHLFDGAAEPREQMLREILRGLILHLRPAWALLLQHGRHVIRGSVPREVRQCFETAGFFRPAPDPESIEWWDQLSNYFRSAAILGRMEVGRRGEMLSMDYERDRLLDAGHVGPEPLWAAIEDETLGYDIISCDVQPEGTKPIYIEVKASEYLPFVFYLTENEWKVAQSLKEAYIFHFWHLPTKTLTIVSINDVSKHIPLNQGYGVWKKAQILWQQA